MVMGRCPCGCEFEVSHERAVVIKCPKCEIVVIAPDMERAEQILAAKIREKVYGEKGDREGSSSPSECEGA